MQTHAFYASQGNKETYIYIYIHGIHGLYVEYAEYVEYVAYTGASRGCEGQCGRAHLPWPFLVLPWPAFAPPSFPLPLLPRFPLPLSFPFLPLTCASQKSKKLPRRRLAFPIAALALLLPDVFVCFFELLRPWSTLLQKSNMENIILQSSLLYSSLCDCIALYCIVLYCIV